MALEEITTEHLQPGDISSLANIVIRCGFANTNSIAAAIQVFPGDQLHQYLAENWEERSVAPSDSVLRCADFANWLLNQPDEDWAVNMQALDNLHSKDPSTVFTTIEELGASNPLVAAVID